MQIDEWRDGKKIATHTVDDPGLAPTVSIKDLRAQLAAAGTVAATKAVLGELLDALDPSHPTTVAP